VIARQQDWNLFRVQSEPEKPVKGANFQKSQGKLGKVRELF